jgi:hypothetical protein
MDRVFSGDSVSGGWSGPVAGGDVGGAFRELAFGEDCAGPNELPAQEALTLRQRAWAASMSL